METTSRTANSIKNIKTGIMVQIVNKFMAFICRSFFIYYLNTEYLGVNGLFTNILSVLSFAELGIGSAIIYNMYKPVLENDTAKIKSLMQLYKKAYSVIGCIVFSLGLLIIPFLKYLITDVPNIKESITIIYLMFLFDTSASYFFTYKKSIITAHQKQRVINNIDSVFYLVRSTIQILVLALTKQFLLYLAVQIIGTLLENIMLANVATRMYPYLKEKHVDALSKSEIKFIFNNVKALAIYQFGAVIMNGTDNILISAFVGVATVGLCSNYTLLMNSLKLILSSGLSGLTASVGNLNATSSISKKEQLYNQMTLAYFMIYSFCSFSFMAIVQPFIKLWIGEGYLLSYGIVVILTVNFFIEGIRMPGYMFRTTLGLFENSKYTPYLGAFSNIIFSIAFCKMFGLFGIYLGTVLSQLVSYFWIDPYIIYKFDFRKSPIEFYKRLIKYIGLFGIEGLLCFLIVTFNTGSIFCSLVISVLASLLIPNLISYLCFKNTDEFKNLDSRFLQAIIRKIKRIFKWKV